MQIHEEGRLLGANAKRISATEELFLAGALCVCLAGFPLHGARAQTVAPESADGMFLHMPSSIKAGHDDLLAQLADLERAPGKVGESARKMSGLLRTHFLKMEEFVLPPLGLLPGLAAGKLPDDLQGPLRLVNRVEADMPETLRKRQQIEAELQHLREAAQSERNADAMRFSERLAACFAEEKQILYPGAILAGEYMRLRYMTRGGR